MSSLEPDRLARTRVRRHPERGLYDRAAVDAVLDSSLFAHVAFVDSGQPVCVPLLYARVGDLVYVHGSSASRALRRLGTGAPACLTVTLLDGLVLARSAFEHSANYRSAMLFGRLELIADAETRLAAFEAFTNKLVPGRWAEVREPAPKELKATAILALSIEQASVKIRTGPPSDGEDSDAAIWAGIVPVVSGYGAAVPAPEVADDIPLPDSVRALREKGER